MDLFMNIFWPAWLVGWVGFGVYTIWDIKFGTAYKIHKEMTIHFSKEFGKGTFEQFLREFKGIKWQTKNDMPEAYFDPESRSMINAGIIMFNGKGMIFSSVREHTKFKRHMKKLEMDGKKKDYDWTEQSKPLLEAPDPLRLEPAGDGKSKVKATDPSLN